MSECLFCNTPFSCSLNWRNLFSITNRLICDDCNRQLEVVEGGCQYCCKKTEGEVCEDCKFWLHNDMTKMIRVQNRSLYYYNEMAKRVLERIKFKGDCRLLDPFKYPLWKFFETNYPPNDYVIVPTPIPKNRLYERGFNQVTYLISELPYETCELFVKTTTEKQSKKKRHERLRLVKQFSIKPQNHPIPSHKKILLVDDLYTTGATIHNMARELDQHGYTQKIESFTLFRG